MLPRLRFGTLLSCLLLASCALSARGQSTFSNPRRIPTTVDPARVTVGDLNNDGRPDIIWSDLTTSPVTLHVLLDGPGEIYTSAPSLNVPSATSSPSLPHCIVTDVNNDKLPDLVCGLQDLTTAELVIFNGNGDGTFRSPVTVSLPPGAAYYGTPTPVPFPLGDVNGDGIPDILLADFTSAGADLWVMVADGHNGFQPHAIASSYLRYGIYGHIAQLADVNGDGIPDLLFDSGPSVALGHGDGTFDPLRSYNFVSNSECMFADFDGDGHLDAACSSISSNQQVKYFVLHGNTDGSFNAPLTQTSVSVPGSDLIDAVADLNGDGRPDLIVSGGIYITPLFTSPNLSFTAGESFVGGRNSSFPSQLGTAATVDLNGDGLLDSISVGHLGLEIAYGQTGGSFASATAPNVGVFTDVAAAGDFDGDGIPDIVTAGAPSLYFSHGKGDGTFGPAVALPRPADNASFDAPGGLTCPSCVNDLLMAGDFDGDGKQDILAYGSPLVYEEDLYFFRGNGDGTFQTPVKVPSTGTMVSFGIVSDHDVVDLATNGHNELLHISDNSVNPPTLGCYTLQNGSTLSGSSLTMPAESYGTFTYDDVPPVAADFAHRGLKDAVTAAQGFVYIVPSTGVCTFNAAGILKLAIPPVAGAAGQQTWAVAAGDFDGDGNQDIALLLQLSGSGTFSVPYTNLGSVVLLYYGRGDGTFSAPVTATHLAPLYGSLTAVDLNGDGRSDLIVRSSPLIGLGGAYQPPNPSIPNISVLYGQANRTLGPEVPFAQGTFGFSMSVADFNHDGFPDLLFGNGSNFVSVLLSMPQPTVTGTVTASPEPSVVGNQFTLTATLRLSSGIGLLSGPMSFSVDNSPVGQASLSGNVATLSVPGTFAVGQHTLSATWPGDSTYSATTLTGTHTVTALPLAITLSAAPNPAFVQQAITLSVDFPGAPNTFPGTLTFLDGTAPLGSTQPSTTGYSLTLPSLAAGTHTLTATYSGDATFAPATSNSVIEVINLWPSTSDLSPLTPSTYGAPLTLSASVSPASTPAHGTPSGSVVFTDTTTNTAVAASALSSTASASATLNALSAGTHTFTCTYSGDTIYAASACAPRSLTVAPASTTIALSAAPNPAYTNQTVSLTATVTSSTGVAPTGTVAFFDGASTAPLGSSPVGSGGIATLPYTGFTVGTHPLTAVYTPSANFITSTSAAFNEIILPSDFAIALNPPAVSVSAGSTATVGVQLSSLGNFAGPLSLTLGTLPPVATGKLTPASVTLTAGGTASSTLTITTAQHVEATVPSRPGSRNTPAILVALTLLPLAVRRRRRRHLRSLLLAVLAAVLLTSATGCFHSAFTVDVVAGGSYPITVTATDSAGTSHSAVLILNVTP